MIVFTSLPPANWRPLPLIARSFSHDRQPPRSSDMAHSVQRRTDGSLRRRRPETMTCIARVDVLNLPPL
jgi:hypothetical protein